MNKKKKGLLKFEYNVITGVKYFFEPIRKKKYYKRKRLRNGRI